MKFPDYILLFCIVAWLVLFASSVIFGSVEYLDQVR